LPIELQRQKPEGTPWVVILGIVLVIALGLFVAYSSIGGSGFSLPSFSSQPKQEVILLQAADCTECISLASAQAVFKIPMRNVTSGEEFNKLVSKYSIRKLPALIVSNQSLFTEQAAGQVVQQFTLRAGALVYETVTPPYYDISNRKVKGVVNATVISPANCSQCVATSDVLGGLGSIGVNLQRIDSFQETDSRAVELIGKYHLTVLPVFIFSPDLLEYSEIAQQWAKIGSTEADGNLVLNNLFAPYKNLSNGNTEGLVKLTYISANVCRTCYNATLHRNVLVSQFKLYIANETTVDASSSQGAALLRQYNLTRVPTVILSKEARAYASLKTAWSQVGSFEPDGAFVFRAVDQLQNVNYTTVTNGVVSPNGIATESTAASTASSASNGAVGPTS